jgi:hypothetical protein
MQRWCSAQYCSSVRGVLRERLCRNFVQLVRYMHAERRLSVHKLLCALEYCSSNADDTVLC